MAYPRSLGKNSLSSNSLFFQRERYDNIVFPDQGEISEKPEVRNINLFYKKPFYGRIDLSSAPVISDFIIFSPFSQDFISTDSLRYMKKYNSAKGKEKYAMNFVIDAFNDMQKYVNNSCTVRGTANVNSRITPLGIVKSYTGTISSYNAYINFYYSEFFRSITDFETTSKIKNFDDFYNLFSQFLLLKAKDRPICFSTFIASKECPANISGMVLEVDEFDYSNDEEKISLFLNDINFDFFAKGAARFGFRIDKHVPFRLIADIQSEVMLEYMKKYTVNSKEELFEKQFIKAHLLDLNFLKDLFYTTYSAYVTQNPQYEEFKKIDNCTFKKNYFIGDRQIISLEEFYQKYDNSFWLRFYINLKFIENKLEKQKYLLNTILNHSLNLYNVSSNIATNLELSVNYINDKILNFYNYEDLNKALTVR